MEGRKKDRTEEKKRRGGGGGGQWYRSRYVCGSGMYHVGG